MDFFINSNETNIHVFMHIVQPMQENRERKLTPALKLNMHCGKYSCGNRRFFYDIHEKTTSREVFEQKNVSSCHVLFCKFTLKGEPRTSILPHVTLMT